jgi:hypothetical protein
LVKSLLDLIKSRKNNLKGCFMKYNWIYKQWKVWFVWGVELMVCFGFSFWNIKLMSFPFLFLRFCLEIRKKIASFWIEGKGEKTVEQKETQQEQ